MQYCIDSDTYTHYKTRHINIERDHKARTPMAGFYRSEQLCRSLGSTQAETKFHLCQHARNVIIVYLLVSGESHCVAGLRRSASRTGPCTAYLLENLFWEGVFQPKAHEPRRAGVEGAAGACKARATSPAADEASAEH